MKRLGIITSSVAGVSLLTIASIGVASAATPSVTGNVGTSGISRTVFKEERLDAVAQVLDTSTTNIQSAVKDKTLHSLVTNAGLTKKSFAEKVKSQLTSDLESQGYSQDQVTIALQHRAIDRLHHKDKK